MPYKFSPYKSTYIDLKSQEVNKILADRYSKVLQTRDALQDELLKVKSAPFENDKDLLNQLVTTTNNRLEGYADGMALENMTGAISQDVRNFTNIYGQIKNNYDSTQTFLKDLEERYNSGKISEKAYKYGLGYVSQGYNGLELDDNGNINPSSGFKGGTIFDDVDLEKEIREALSILPTEKFSNQQTWTEYDPAVGGWKHTNGREDEWIDPSKVREITNQIINKYSPNISQASDINAYIAESSGVLEDFGKKMAESYDTAIQDINSSLADPKVSADDKKLLSSNKDEYIKSLTELNKNLTNQEFLKNLYRQTDYSNTVSKYQSYGDKKAFHNVKTTTGLEGDYSTIKARVSYEINNPVRSIQVQEEVTAENDVSGGSYNNKKEYILNIDKDISNLESSIKNDNLSGKSLNDAKETLLALRIEKQRVESQLKSAGDLKVSMADLESADSRILQIFKDRMPGATSGQIYQQILNTFDNPNDQDYMDYKAAFDNKYGRGSFDLHIKQDKYNRIISKPIVTGSPLTMGTSPSSGTEEQPHRYSVYEYFSNTFIPKINDAFPEIKTSVVSFTSTGDAGMDKALTSYLTVGQPLPNGTYLADNGELLGSADIVAKASKELGKDDIVVTNPWRYDPINGDIYIDLGSKSDPGKVMPIRAKNNQISVTGLQDALNSTPTKFANYSKVLSAGNLPGYEFTIPEIYVGNNPYIIQGKIENGGDIKYTILNSDGSIIPQFSKNGVPIKYSQSDPVLEGLLNNPHTNFAFPK